MSTARCGLVLNVSKITEAPELTCNLVRLSSILKKLAWEAPMTIVLKPCCEPMLVAHLAKTGNILICYHISNKTTKIPEETVSDVRRTDNCSAERRDIRHWIIAICFLESLDHIVCPVLATCFVTILNNDLECLAILCRDTLDNLAEIVVEMSADMLLAHLVCLKTTSFLRCRAAFNSSCKHTCA